MTTTIWWLRRDLRLRDNQALNEALSTGEKVIPLFILDPGLLNSPYIGEKRLFFLFAGLQALHEELSARGSFLLIRQGDPAEVLATLVKETSAVAIIAEADHSPYARRRDRLVAKDLPLSLTKGLTVQHPGDVLKDNGEPYTVYTPYSKKWKATLPQLGLLADPEKIPSPAQPQGVGFPDLPELDHPLPFRPGASVAQEKLKLFTEGITRPINAYADQRNRMDLEGTSGLSPYLRFGMLSAREAVAAAIDAMETSENASSRKGAETWLNELIWREFYISILYHFPHVRERTFRTSLQNIPWDNDETAFSAWCAGETGYPVVDAAMRQLLATGWMHNRARMIVASFLTKDLLIDWQWGEKWFMQHLVDGDPAANNGGWQWTAGTGTDAAPYFRIFNPVLQSKKFDPQGAFICKYVPELRHVTDEYIHEPWRMSPAQQRETGCEIGHHYPLPIIDHKWARQRTLEAYAQAKEL